jgi:putative SOS response-associated peptidase YedK
MCGWYALNQNARELARQFNLFDLPDIVPRFNIAPSTAVLVIRESQRGRIGELMTLRPRTALGWQRSRRAQAAEADQRSVPPFQNRSIAM